MFNRKKPDTFSSKAWSRKFSTPNVSIHTKEFFTGVNPDYVPIVEPPRPETAGPNFNPLNFNFMNFA